MLCFLQKLHIVSFENTSCIITVTHKCCDTSCLLWIWGLGNTALWASTCCFKALTLLTALPDDDASVLLAGMVESETHHRDDWGKRVWLSAATKQHGLVSVQNKSPHQLLLLWLGESLKQPLVASRFWLCLKHHRKLLRLPIARRHLKERMCNENPSDYASVSS